MVFVKIKIKKKIKYLQVNISKGTFLQKNFSWLTIIVIIKYVQLYLNSFMNYDTKVFENKTKNNITSILQIKRQKTSGIINFPLTSIFEYHHIIAEFIIHRGPSLWSPFQANSDLNNWTQNKISFDSQPITRINIITVDKHRHADLVLNDWRLNISFVCVI